MELVLDTAKAVALFYAERLNGICTDELYSSTREEGHTFLQMIHQKAVELGVQVELKQVDIPLTPGKLLVDAGYAEIQDGKIRLTARGKESAREVELAMIRKCIIKITSIPEGPGIPEEIRKGWVGVVFEAEGPTEMVLGSAMNPGSGQCYGVKSVYKVPSGLALTALKNHNRESWEWFNSQPMLSEIFAFNADCCEVTEQ